MSQIEPEEEEEQEQQKKSGRSAFMAGVHRGEGDGFSGSYRGVPAVPHGGAASVRPEDIIGQPDCWCGQVYGHSWPGKDKGAPHPRGEQMSTAATEDKPYLNPRDLKSWDRQVVRALCALVNDHGVRFRIDRNQMHIFLFAPSGTEGEEEVTKFKASRSRSPEQTLTYLEKWATKYVRPAKVEEAASVLAERFNDPTKKPHVKPVKAASAPAPQPMDPTPSPAPSAPPAPSPAPPAEREEYEDTPPEGFEEYINTRGESLWWKKINEDLWLCKDCDYTCTTVQQFSGHRRFHNQPMFARKRAISYLARAAAEMGIDLSAYDIHLDAHRVVESTSRRGSGEDVARLTKQVDDLTKLLEKVTAERDDVQARFQLAKEAFSL